MAIRFQVNNVELEGHADTVATVFQLDNVYDELRKFAQMSSETGLAFLLSSARHLAGCLPPMLAMSLHSIVTPLPTNISQRQGDCTGFTARIDKNLFDRLGPGANLSLNLAPLQVMVGGPQKRPVQVRLMVAFGFQASLSPPAATDNESRGDLLHEAATIAEIALPVVKKVLDAMSFDNIESVPAFLSEALLRNVILQQRFREFAGVMVQLKHMEDALQTKRAYTYWQQGGDDAARTRDAPAQRTLVSKVEENLKSESAVSRDASNSLMNPNKDWNTPKAPCAFIAKLDDPATMPANPSVRRGRRNFKIAVSPEIR